MILSLFFSSSLLLPSPPPLFHAVNSPSISDHFHLSLTPYPFFWVSEVTASLVSEPRSIGPGKLAPTRSLSAMEEAMRTILEEQKRWLQQQIQAQNDNIATYQQRMLEQQQQHMREQQQLIHQQNQLMITQILAQLEQDKDKSESRQTPINQGGNNVQFNPKIEFPVFEGIDPRGWIKKCTRYFGLCRIHEHQKVDLASLYLRGAAETWFVSYIRGRRGVTWEEFVMDVCVRFRDNLDSKVVEEFNRLQQTGTLDEYLAKFEELKALILIRNPNMPDTYLLESFIGGLKPAIKSLVRAFKPQTLDLAIEQARFQEEHIHSLKLPPDRNFKPNLPNSKPLLPTPLPPNFRIPQNTPVRPSPNSHVNSKFPTQNPQKPYRFIPAAERAEKMAKGLCFLCDQPFERGHKCSSPTKQLFLVEVLEDEAEAEAEAEAGEAGILNGKVEFNDDELVPQISINVMSGHPGFNTMRVAGLKGKKTLHILIDSGSTHNFLDEHLATKLGCKLEPITTQSVVIAGGSTLQCQFMVREFTWILHGIEFSADILLLPLGGCDLVLGVQWLSTLGVIKWDFE